MRLGRIGTVIGAGAVALVLVLGVAADRSTGPVTVAAASTVPTGPALRIMPLGTSSTVGAGSLATAGFRGPLEALLARDGIVFDMVGSQHSGPSSLPDRDHEGHGGKVMAQLQPFIGGWVHAQRPDVVLLQMGTNDLNTGVSAVTTARRLDTVMATIHLVAPSAYVIVAGVWAPLRTHLPARAKYARLAGAVVARHRAAGEPATFVDTSALLGPGDLFDGLHPDAAGYRKIAAMWDREIESWLLRCRRSGSGTV